MNKASSSNHSIEVLIAEDSPTQAAQLEHLLETNDYRVIRTANGKEALAQAQAHPPDLIISDIVMPELDGYGFCKAVKADERLKNIPVMLVTTLSDPQDIIRGLDAGADNFIRKPYEEKYLLARIHYLLMNFEMRKQQRVQVGVEINLGGKRQFITAERQQIFDLLISVYDQAIGINEDLKAREQSLAQSYSALNTLHRFAEGLNHAVNEKEVGEQALAHAAELSGITGGWIWLLEGDCVFRTVATWNLPEPLTKPSVFQGECECQRLVLNGELDATVKSIKCDRLSGRGGEDCDTSHHFSIPLWLDNRLIGIMNLIGQTEAKDKQLSDILAGIGNQVSVALGRATLHENLERLVEERTAALRGEITERKRAEERIRRLNRVYAVLSGINTTIVRVRDRQQLFEDACRIAVDEGQFKMAWVGLLEADGQTVKPVAVAGFEDGYLDHIGLGLSDARKHPCQLVRLALQARAPVVCNDIATDERMAHYRDAALKRGYRSVVVFPLAVDDKVIGVLPLYASETNFFDTEEMTLLIELAGDVSFALDYIEKQEQVDYLAYYDVLTGLPNRSLLYERLTQYMNTARESDTLVALILIDIERFRVINETFGQHIGDALLRQVAKRLSSGKLDARQLARSGADCFAICLTDLRNEAEVVHTLERGVLTALSDPFEADGSELRVAAKVGIAVFPANGTSADALFHNAEAALKKAKLSGEKYMFYAPELNAQVAQKLHLENKLRRAVEEDQLVLHYQPKVNLKSGQIIGVEALMRWLDPDSGLVPPLTFIPILEETGLIHEAGRWALSQAMSAAKAWQTSGLTAPRIAVNVSSIQLRQKDFVAAVERVLQDVPGMADKLALEITESLIMQDIEGNIKKLRAIKEMGVRISVDDFGTGYSSLSYIAKLPIDELKIDRAFITNMALSPDDLSIVSTIISLAHALNLAVIAEGVETEEQANLLRLLKCDEIQGYLFSPAVEGEQLVQMLREGRSLGARQGPATH